LLCLLHLFHKDAIGKDTQTVPPTHIQTKKVRYIPGPATRNHTPIAITLTPRRNTAVRTPNNTMVSDGGLLADIRRNGRVREQQRILQQAGRDAEEQEHTPEAGSLNV
jgi:hypothetical protein